MTCTVFKCSVCNYILHFQTDMIAHGTKLMHFVRLLEKLGSIQSSLNKSIAQRFEFFKLPIQIAAKIFTKIEVHQCQLLLTKNQLSGSRCCCCLQKLLGKIFVITTGQITFVFKTMFVESNSHK